MATCPSCQRHYPDDVATCAADGLALLPDAAFANADKALSPGDRVGEYVVESKLGEGGFGTVYRGVHPVIGKQAAIKVLDRSWSSDPQMVSRFIAEARAVNQIRHKNIIDIFAFGALADGRQFYVMELLEGESLEHWLEHHGRIAVGVALAILRGVARAVDAAHQKGIAHRDLKPDNVFLVFDDESNVSPKLLDFGIAKLLNDGQTMHKTTSGTPMGTPPYMSPEQIRGVDVDQRTDIYAFGVMCHQVLAGRLPFIADTAMSMLLLHLNEPPPPLSRHAPDLPAALDAPLLRMLAKEPADRPPSLSAGLDAVIAAAESSGINVPAVARLVRDGAAIASEKAEFASAPTMAQPQTSPAATLSGATTAASTRRSATPWLLGVAGVALLAGGVFVMTHRSEDGARRPAPAATSTGSASGLAASSATANEASSAAAARPGASAPTPSSSIELTIEGAPKGAVIMRGEEKLGNTPGPIALSRGSSPVSLTVKADGYESAKVDVVPSANVIVEVSPKKLTTPPPGDHKKIHKDLEGF